MTSSIELDVVVSNGTPSGSIVSPYGFTGSLRVLDVTLPSIQANNNPYTVFQYTGPGRIQFFMPMTFTVNGGKISDNHQIFTIDPLGKLITLQVQVGGVPLALGCRLYGLYWVSNQDAGTL